MSLIEQIPSLGRKQIKKLAGGGCIGAYRWNSGGSFKGKDWNENLPADTQILMHFLSVYLNSCLPVYGDRPDKKAFSSRDYFTRQDKLKPLDTVAIIEEKIHPPLFSVSDGNISWEVAKRKVNQPTESRIGIMLYSVFPCGLVLYLANILGYLCGSSFFLSALFGAFKFTVPRLLPAVRLETTQMKLFGIHKSDPGFQEISPEKEKPKEKTSTPLSYRKVVDLPLTPVESVNVSWAELPGNTSYLTSTDSLSPVSSQSLSLDSTTSSWTYRRTSKASSPIDERQNISGREGESKIVDESFRRKIFHSKSLLSVTQTDEGIDYDSLERTSKLMNELERGLTSPEQTKLYSTRSTFGDFSPVIRGHYQLATSSPVSADKGLENESSKVAASHRGEQIWQTLKVDDSSLLQWRQNFRC
ncbi:hypothetical protein QYM36_004244, partial [Artemia franciscana]